jgi:hypothetical protein
MVDEAEVDFYYLLIRRSQADESCKWSDSVDTMLRLVEEDRGTLMCTKQRLDNTPISVSALENARMKSWPDNDNGEAIDTACGEHNFLTDSR